MEKNEMSEGERGESRESLSPSNLLYIPSLMNRLIVI